MPSKTLPVVQVKALASGTPEFEAARTALVEEFAAQVPDELRLPPELINDAPKNVTGIPRQCGLLSAQELDITEKYDATALAALIAEKKLTSVAVVTAFAKRAIIAHQLTSCLTEWFLDEAVERAKHLDEHLRSTGETVGPLHGVPISIKEHMPIAGHWSSVGFLDTRVRDEEDCQMVAILRAAGAVFYCKTNQPQAIMHLESSSVWGRVLNPHNIRLSAGGSTGGEAALLAMRGSVLGVGTDIGGSVRSPSGFCGIYGFKPTSYTLPTKDYLLGGTAAELNILVSTGPMCSSLRDMDLFMSAVLASRPHLLDPRLIPIPWAGLDSAPKPGPLKIGIMMNDGVIVPQPPVIRALRWAAAKLEASGGGFSVKPFEPYGAAAAMKNIRLAYWPDGGAVVKKHLAATGEPMLPLTRWIIKDAEGPGLKPMEMLQQRLDRDSFRCDFARHWESQDVDFVVCPVFVGPACEHETAFYWNYTAFWNYVDYPGAVVPTPIRAHKKSSPAEEGYAAPDAPPPLSRDDEHVRKMWEEGDFEGAPVGLQVVARRYHDNDLFAALGKMQRVLELP
ncbi:acetamidase [Trichoderma cornu-damae]|uniref:Acetamidase n=1 Tax=Trichoderma cornu-damae TaxID=654480 RepID=A0A9P8U108_9HYPO|nr:acetamidase [Trichoderma cornu-damae]